MKSYVHQFSVNATLQQVSEFHQNPSALQLLTPPPMIVSFNNVEPLKEGSIADFVMWLGPIPIHWVAVHSDVDILRGFSDTQQIGPFKYWEHRHRFEAVDGDTTRIIDEIQAEPGNGIWEGLVSRFMWINLPILFAYRAWKTRRMLEK